MENQPLLENLLIKYLQGKLTISERRQFNDLLADDLNETVFKKLILNHITDFPQENSFSDRNTDFEELYKGILSQLDIDNNGFKTPVSHQSRFRKMLYTSVAAAILTGVFFLGRIFPVQSESNQLIQPSYTEIKSPYGSRSEILLPDGTSVILNAGSTLKYGNDFDQNNRNIDLYGEAYFKVAKNPDIPLVVTAGYIDVIAVGTEFNIKAYPEEKTIETTLIEGKVEIVNSNSNSNSGSTYKEGRDNDMEFIDLEPNQKAIFYKGEEGYKLENIKNKAIKPEPVKPFLDNILISPKADVEKTVAWTQGKLIFRGESFEDLCVDLQRKYDVNFVFIDENLKSYRFTGVLLDETLEQVLNVIKLTAPIDFSIEAKKVYLFTDVLQLNGFEEHLK